MSYNNQTNACSIFMERIILHCDLNNFYASVECFYNPVLRDVPFAVTGSEDERHGIVLAKNYPAKAFGIKTGDTVLDARRKCPKLVTKEGEFEKYLHYSKKFKAMLLEYSDLVESFGIDESWVDATQSCGGKSGKQIADELRQRIRDELGLTISVGVSWNKIFAKLGSDLKKPDATTVIDRSNYRDKVWSLPAAELLYVGKATNEKLSRRGIYTIGDIANANEQALNNLLGKWGSTLKIFANGQDSSEVKQYEEGREVKSVGNSLTCYRDLTTNHEVMALFYVLAESVASRIRQGGFVANNVGIYVRDTELVSFVRQANMKQPTQLSGEIAAQAMVLFVSNYTWTKSIRSLGVRVSGFGAASRQLSLLSQDDYEKGLALEQTIEKIRDRFGHGAIQRGAVFTDKKLIQFDPEEQNTIHPVGFMG